MQELQELQKLQNKKQLSPFMLHGCLAAHVWYFSW
jgi:hypothetical protein